MAELICNPLFWVASIPTILLGCIIYLMIRHHNAISKFNNRLSNFNGDLRIEREVSGIGVYVQIIAYIAIAFCVGVAIHYLAVELPRVLDSKAQNAHLHNLGVDYLGLIVAIFGVIVTFLVAWQIFSTIKAKEELRDTQREIKADFESKIKDFDTRLTRLSAQQAKTEGRVEEKRQSNQPISLALPPEVLEFSLAKMAKETSPLYIWLSEIIDDVKTTTDILNEYSRVLKKSPKKVKYINDRFATEAEIIALINEIRPIRIMILNAIKGNIK